MNRSQTRYAIAHAIIVTSLSDIAASYVGNRYAKQMRRRRSGQYLEPVAKAQHQVRALCGK